MYSGNTYKQTINIFFKHIHTTNIRQYIYANAVDLDALFGI
jgi:hypothetical protein